MTVDPEVVDPKDIELLQDLIASAIADVLRKGGFTRVRRAAETPTNMVLEGRA